MCVFQIPLLVFMLSALLYSSFPGVFAAVGSFVWSVVRVEGPADLGVAQATMDTVVVIV